MSEISGKVVTGRKRYFVVELLENVALRVVKFVLGENEIRC